ncbi:MAG: hypothetical protein ACR2PB_12560 [Desulfocapsaceae bacterium]
MKTAIIILLLLTPVLALAQNTGGMNQGNMQNMMQVMQQVQECMAGIDQAKLQELQVRSEKMSKEIKGLCSKDQRDKAQKTAISFAKEIASDPTLKQMQKCGEMAQGALPMMGTVETFDEKEYANKHVCDE